MKKYVYGAGNIGKHIIKKIKEYNENIDGVIDSFKSGNYEGYEIIPIDKVEKDSAIIISVLNTNSILNIYNTLRNNGFSNIYWYYDAIKNGDKKDFLESECLDMTGWGNSIMPHVELHISDKCNLNCKGCTHFSPLFDEIGAVLEKKMNDIKMLKGLFSDIFRVDVLGGEPLLNPELKDYVIELRKELPNSFIQIYTNGLLIPQLDDDVLKTIADYNIGVSISEYYPTHKIIGKITERLEAHGIRYRVAEYDNKQIFNTPISLSPNSKYPQMCISDGCITVSDGLIARCPTLMYISKFNEYFNQNLPTDGIHHISEYNNGSDLLAGMKKAVPLCKHCISCDMKWSVCGKEKKLQDFAVEE